MWEKFEKSNIPSFSLGMSMGVVEALLSKASGSRKVLMGGGDSCGDGKWSSGNGGGVALLAFSPAFGAQHG